MLFITPHLIIIAFKADDLQKNHKNNLNIEKTSTSINNIVYLALQKEIVVWNWMA
jgi:hypothetical protein